MIVSEKKTALITGGSGLIGRALVAELLQSNRYEVKAQVRKGVQARASIGQNVDLTRVLMQECDFTRARDIEIQALTKGCDVIIHAAGLAHRSDASYQEYEVLNVRATQQLVETAASHGVNTFVFLSSAAVYGSGPFDMADETTPIKATTPYAVSKITSEKWLQSFRGVPRIVILRPPLVFGEGDKGNLLKLIKEIKDRRYRHIGSGDTGKSIIYAKDLAYAVSLCLEKLPEGVHVFNVANPQPVTMKILADEIARCLNLDYKIPSVPPALARLGLNALELLAPGKAPTVEQLEKLTTTTTCSIDRLVAATGFQPRTALATALKAEIAWAVKAELI